MQLRRQVIWGTRERWMFHTFYGKLWQKSCRRVWQPTPVFLPGESPWTEEPGRLQCIGLYRVGQDWSYLSWHVVQLLSYVLLFVTPGTAVHQASLSFTISWSLLKLMSIESVMPSNHLILCHPLLLLLQSFPASGSFQMSQFFSSGGQPIGASASASVLPMNIQDWSPTGWTGWISLQSKGLSRVFSNTTVQKHQFFCTQLSL